MHLLIFLGDLYVFPISKVVLIQITGFLSYPTNRRFSLVSFLGRLVCVLRILNHSKNAYNRKCPKSQLLQLCYVDSDF